MLVLLLKNAKILNLSSFILFDTDTGHTNKANSIKSFEGKNEVYRKHL